MAEKKTIRKTEQDKREAKGAVSRIRSQASQRALKERNGSSVSDNEEKESPEQDKEASKKRPPEQRSEAAPRASENKGPRERSENDKKTRTRIRRSR
jgi:hypothetical protein